jgi:hypothetical protein
MVFVGKFRNLPFAILDCVTKKGHSVKYKLVFHMIVNGNGKLLPLT